MFMNNGWKVTFAPLAKTKLFMRSCVCRTPGMCYTVPLEDGLAAILEYNFSRVSQVAAMSREGDVSAKLSHFQCTHDLLKVRSRSMKQSQKLDIKL